MKLLHLLSILLWITILSCSHSPLDLAGGSTSTPNEVVMGYAVLPSGAPASRTIVQLIPSSYAAIGAVSPSALPTDTTDKSGAYCFSHIDTGIYNIQAVQIDTRTRALVTSIAVDTDTVRAPSAVVTPPGRLLVVISNLFNPTNGYLYIPGTTVANIIDGKQDTLVLDSVPMGLISRVCYTTTGGSEHTVLRYNVPISSGETVTLSKPKWKFSRQLYLNTTVNGAAVTGNVLDFPVLIRLTSENFNFSQAQTNGADIRFSKSDNTPLAYEIERWDSTIGKAEIWVKVDTVHGNDSTQYLRMYWGNSNAFDSSAGSAVFDTGNGFNAVWHLGDVPSGNASIIDQTAHKYNATPLGDFTSVDLVNGSIGKGLHFNGTTDIVNPGQQIKKGPIFTVEAWVSITESKIQRFFYDPLGYTLWYDSEMGGLRFEIRDKSNAWHGIPQNGGTVQPITMEKWFHIAGTSDGRKLRLYVNGILATASDTITGTPNPITTSDSLIIGGKSNGEHVKGIMDELRIHTVVRSDEWIKLSYMNQKDRDALLKW